MSTNELLAQSRSENERLEQQVLELNTYITHLLDGLDKVAQADSKIEAQGIADELKGRCEEINKIMKVTNG